MGINKKGAAIAVAIIAFIICIGLANWYHNCNYLLAKAKNCLTDFMEII